MNKTTDRVCAYCYLDLEQNILCCGRCKKHPYCSKECQSIDWKQHKLWCGVTAELHLDYEVRDEGNGKGVGLFAKRAFALGEKILVERSVIRTDVSVISATEDWVKVLQQICNLPSSIQYAISLLHPAMITAAEDVQVVEAVGAASLRFKYNCISLGGDDDASGSGLFINAARLNHSCVPNCNRTYLRDQKLLVISADAAIAEGEELTISYSSKAESKQEQAKDLAGWGFSCTCPACVVDNDDIYHINRLDNELLQLTREGRMAESYVKGLQILAICDELERSFGCRCCTRRGRTYHDMFQILGGQEETLPNKAIYYAEKQLECELIYMGGSNPECSDIKCTRFSIANLPLQYNCAQTSPVPLK